ncbi:HlyD family efflux transporter periplasmic adaptor subunit [uncultured Psychroserpens sp.]|uniref:HlyD family secretion protein n=1 Tax=uncultured Psychroserpens sp. TaxID=255436 RepID=UPI00262E4DF2|nr:HlyD family efflux transporter periplasmic adaptor subunit [uncultured Psychroserpens sp.]
MPINTTDIELRSEEVQDVLESVPHWMIRYGNMVLLALIIMLLFISWFVKYPDIITSEAAVTTKLPPQKKYVRLSGRLDSLFVKDNQMVNKGDILALIENPANYNHIKRLKSTIDTIKLNDKKFSFPLEELPILFLGEIDSEYALFENSYLQYQLNKELQPFSNEQNGNRISKAQLYARLNTLKNQKTIQKQELDFQKKELERHQKLFNKGVISKQEIESKELVYLQSERNYANMDASISQIREAIGNANTNTINTTINQTKEDIGLLKNVIQSFNQLKRALISWEMKYAVVSDMDGKVAFSKLWVTNQRVNQGDLLFTIIPEENSAYIAKLKTPAQNSGKIKTGQTVNIKLENYPDTEFGTIQGHIKSISLLPDENGFYLITVSLPDKLITSYKKEIPFRYEMRGSAEIITEDLRLIERFFYQLKNVFK